MKKLDIAVGREVAFNMLDDATWFAVEAIDGFTLTVREVGTEYAPQMIDKSAVKRVRPGANNPAFGKLQGEYRGYRIYARMGWFDVRDAEGQFVGNASYHAGAQTIVDNKIAGKPLDAGL
ncbi:hypothetical protein [Sphingomonas phage Birtae]|nr:hypothetical protein [Sphingomonas phage Birtae]